MHVSESGDNKTGGKNVRYVGYNINVDEYFTYRTTTTMCVFLF